MKFKSIKNQAYLPTEIEHLANIVTHGVCVLPSLMGLHFMVQRASTSLQTISVVIYGLASIALFLISTVFHLVFYTKQFSNWKNCLHRCDRAVIYLFIAASYTPWLMLKYKEPGIAVHINWIVWLLACLGIIYQQIYHERYKWLETLFYLLLGVLPAMVIVKMPEWSGLFELAIGGCIYIMGIYFFKSDGRIPFAHAIWHVFVMIAAAVHYYAVYKYLLGKRNEKQTLPLPVPS